MPFDDVHIAAKRNIARAQRAFRLEIIGKHGFIIGHDFAGEHTGFEQKIAVDQAAQANHHNGGMSENIAPFVHSTFFGRHQHRAIIAHRCFAAEALHRQIALRHFGRDAAAFQQRAVAHGRQRLAAGFEAVRLHLAHKRRNIAPQA